MYGSHNVAQRRRSMQIQNNSAASAEQAALAVSRHLGAARAWELHAAREAQQEEDRKAHAEQAEVHKAQMKASRVADLQEKARFSRMCAHVAVFTERPNPNPGPNPNPHPNPNPNPNPNPQP